MQGFEYFDCAWRDHKHGGRRAANFFNEAGGKLRQGLGLLIRS